MDGRSPITARGDHPLLEEPVTDEERMKVAGQCMVAMSISDIPAVVDRVDDAVNFAYAAWPDRLYLVGENGELAYGSERGPFGFHPAELEMAICKELGREIPEGLEEEIEKSKSRWERMRGGSRGERAESEGPGRPAGRERPNRPNRPDSPQ